MEKSEQKAPKWTRATLIVGSIVTLVASSAAFPFQIAPLGSSFEARMTNEPESTLAKVAGKLGKLVKRPVHEEITNLAFNCPADLEALSNDEECAQRDAPFATAFIIYGVRWNDLPPFQLRKDEGQRCKKFLTRGAACNIQQTIRFSTQPECWYCVFTNAEQFTAKGGTIAGCPAEKGGKRHVALGNLLTRSHYGDLQFLHSMAVRDAMPAAETQAQILAWVQFAWRVSIGEIKPTQRLAQVDIPFIAERFACTEWTVADLYILGRQDKLLPSIRDIAFGSILHTVQDSFSSSHTERESTAASGFCADNSQYQKPSRIVEFHSYGSQDGHLHDAEDARDAMVGHVIERKTEAVAASRMLVELRADRRPWADVRPYAECLFELNDPARFSSPGDAYRKPKEE